MTDLNEKLKLVAEYTGAIGVAESGYRPSEGVYKPYKFHTDYNEQIPVWQKVCKEFGSMKDKCTDDLKHFMLMKEYYCKLICYGTPLESFEILVQAIIFINNLKQK